ncbi:MAG TPA: NBR1-Ig-like domain-containing protein [Anaerolineales bacterium]
MKKAHLASMLLLTVLFVFACSLPSNAPPTPTQDEISTLAALTVSARLTEQVPAATPTGLVLLPTSTTVVLPTLPPPTSIPPTAVVVTPTSSCNAAQFVSDVTIPDGTLLDPGEPFTKTWRLKNNGTCSWTPSYAAVFSSGNAMGGPATQSLAANVNPGQTVDISINFVAPTTNGTYTATYKLRDAAGVLFSQFYVQIKVETGKFAVTSVTFTTSGSCGSFTATANITVNGAGIVTYKWLRSDGATDTITHDPLEFTSAGTKSVSQSWSTTASGSKWIDIYIDKPNHQQFGRATFTCP